MRLLPACLVPLLLAAGPALADAAAGEACAGALSGPALQIYRAAAPELRADTDLASLLRAKVAPMVLFGPLDTATARVAAKAAADCLEALRR